MFSFFLWWGNDGAKDFIFTSIFLRMIIFFIKIKIWYRIFSISFTGSKFNENLKNDHTSNNKLQLIILKTYVHSLRHRFINQKQKCKDGGSYFYKNQKYRRLEKRKKKFSYFISEIPNFSYTCFFRKCSKFRRSIPLKQSSSFKSKHICLD